MTVFSTLAFGADHGRASFARDLPLRSCHWRRALSSKRIDWASMQVYFSHSYRDFAINSYFLEHFMQEDIPLRGDQKTDIWCVAKLERYLSETTGFVSIIPRRPTEQDPGAYSPYIGHELNLARRARVPRLLFIDEQVLRRHQLDFPEDAVPFRPDALAKDGVQHSDAIRAFSKALETASRPSRAFRPEEATLVVGEGRVLHDAAQDVAEVLKRESYAVTLLTGRRPERGLADIRLLETLWRSELCVFMLSDRLSDAHVALAMAHAHSIPSVRLQYDKRASDCNPSVSGLIRWHSSDDMLVEFARQLTSYREGLVQPVEIAQASTPTDAARRMGTMKWRPRADNVWDVRDGAALIGHVRPEHTFVQDEVNRVRQELKRSLGLESGRPASMQVCHLLYNGVRRHRFGYELEPQTGVVENQNIRTPSQILTHQTATCIDVACLFASLLEAAGQNPVVVILDRPHSAHALAGYRAHDEPPWSNASISDLRRAVELGDAVLFEATGAVEADAPVGAETEQERREKLIDFMDAKAAATRMLAWNDVRLRHLVDVRPLRERGVRAH